MSDRSRIYAQKAHKFNDADFQAIAGLLIKAGYTVRIGRERPAGKDTGAWTYFVEYWM